MRDEYDFSKGKRGYYNDKIKERTTIRLDKDVKIYFQQIAEKEQLPYQTLINLYLRDCMRTKRKLKMEWKKSG